MSYQRGGWCGSPDHGVNRRGFLGGSALAGAVALAADMTVLNLLKEPALADEIKRHEKRVMLLWLAGGASPQHRKPRTHHPQHRSRR